MPTAHDEIRTALRARELRVTPQRLAIFGALRALGRHATAEEVLERVHGTVPGVSLPTVYAGLELLADIGLATRVRAGRAVRYDPRVDPHHHFVCDDCGAVADLDAKVDLASALAGLRASGVEPTGSEVLVRGRCANCASRATAH